jgi:hypothetical protein
MTERWPPGSQQAIGQTGEFLVWATLIAQSGGRLHVFLPTLDRGIDGVIHRLDDGAYLALQVKTKTAHGLEAPIAVLERHVFTDDQIIVGVRLADDHLGEYALVADAAAFKAKAARIVDRRRVLLVADMPNAPDATHKWSANLVPLRELAARLGARPVTTAALPEAPPSPPTVADEDLVVGNWGELEVLRRLAMLEDCGLFRPFPDSETAELLVRRLATGATIGLQIKTAHLDQPHDYRHVQVNRANFVARPTTFITAVAWIASQRRFHETCLLVPSAALPDITGRSGDSYELHFRPDGSSEPSKVDRYRLPLESLAAEISRRLR